MRTPNGMGAALWILVIVAHQAAAGYCVAQFTALELQSSPQGDSKVYAVENGVFGGYSTPNGRPGIWSSIASPFVSLAVNQIGGDVFTIWGSRQFGQWNSRATMWEGTAASYVDLNPPGVDASTIRGASAQCQVGFTQSFATNFDSRATVWFGSAASAVSLHPSGAKDSLAVAAWGSQQGGSARFFSSNLNSHAVLWSGTASGFIDLNPGPDYASAIAGMHEGQQVGAFESIAAGLHAGIWSGTVQSLRDVHPFATGSSALQATCGAAQVGYYIHGNGVRPGIWFGTRESFIDLYPFLPPGAGESAALCVEERNGVFTVGGYARYGTYFRPFVWVGVPSPSSAAPLLAAACFATRRKRR